MDGTAPDFQVTQVDNFTPADDPEIARRVRGTFTVPCYLQPDCDPGGSFQLGGDGLPSRNTGNDWTANFDCIIPRTAIDGPTPAPGRPGDLRARAVRKRLRGVQRRHPAGAGQHLRLRSLRDRRDRDVGR